MFDINEFLANEIREKLNNIFPNITINTFYNSDRDEYNVSINDKELYYSDEYQLMVMEIKQNILWTKNIYNYIFTLDEVSCENMKLLSKLTLEYSYSLNFTNYLTETTAISTTDYYYLYADDQQLAA